MSRYEYRCRDCGHGFEIRERISEHEKDSHPTCPECGSEETEQVLTPFYPDTSSKT